MVRTIAGLLVASVVLFFWGFVVWGQLPFHRWVWQRATDDDAAATVLREQFPQQGTYFVPAPPRSMEEMKDVEARFAKGPLVLVHVLRTDGRPMFDSGMMLSGYLVNLLTLALLAGLLRLAAAGLPTYLSRVQLCGLIGLAAAILIDYGDVIWWEIDRPWKLYCAFYHFTFFLIAGLVLAAFVKPQVVAAGEKAK